MLCPLCNNHLYRVQKLPRNRSWMKCLECEYTCVTTGNPNFEMKQPDVARRLLWEACDKFVVMETPLKEVTNLACEYMVRSALDRTETKTDACKLLKTSRPNLIDKIKQLNIIPD